MANIIASTSGDWHTGSTWVGGVVPGPADVAYLNNHVITVAAEITCLEISSRAEHGAAAGGSLAPVDPLTADGLLPDPSNVRAGVVYGYGNLFGYCNVPAPGLVAYGVPVGDGYGSAILTGANVWSVLLDEITTPGSIGLRLKKCSTIASTGQQLADALSG